MPSINLSSKGSLPADTSINDEDMIDTSMIQDEHDRQQQQEQRIHIQSSSIITKSISGTAVIQLNLGLNSNQIVHITRRRYDSYINAAEIISLAFILSNRGSTNQPPITTERINQILRTTLQDQIQESELSSHWIAFDKAVHLAQSLGVYDLLKTLFFYDGNNSSLNVNFGAGSLTRNYSEITDRDEYDQQDTQLKVNNNGSPLKKVKTALINQNKNSNRSSPGPIQYDNPNKPYSVEPLPTSQITDFAAKREEITRMFAEDEESLLKSWNTGNTSSSIRGEEIDIGIDNEGNTGLHWACALGRTSLAQNFINLGSCVIRGNINGETALIRSVLVTNAYKQDTFAELLDILYPSLMLLDNQGRTILHHLAINAGIKQRVMAVKYYLSTLLEWIVTNGPQRDPDLTIGKFIEKMVNLQDKNGDTALNIAARVGNTVIVQELLDIHADPSIANKAGLKPVDFGIKMTSLHSLNFNSKIDTNGDHSKAARVPEVQSSEKILSSMQALLTRLGEDFKVEIGARNEKLNSLRLQMQLKSQELALVRSHATKLSEYETKSLQLRQRLNNLNKAIAQQEQKFVNSQNNTTDVTASDLANIKYDPDEPFRINLPPHNGSNITAMGASLPSTPFLEARIRAYLANQNTLNNEIQHLQSQSEDLEMKFKRVICLCCQGTKIEEIDEELIDGLVRGVEDFAPEDEINGNSGEMEKVKGFLKRVEQ